LTLAQQNQQGASPAPNQELRFAPEYSGQAGKIAPKIFRGKYTEDAG